MMKFILAIDQGTTGTKALLMDQNLNRVAEQTVNFQQYYPKPSWVEHDLEEIWESVIGSIQAVLKKAEKKVSPKNILAIGITNQRETVCFWEKGTGKPLARAIVWQDRRTSEVCEQLAAKGLEPFFQEKSGLIIDPYFTGTKVAWALRNDSVLMDRLKAKKLAVGTIDSYLMARLSGGEAHLTEPSNASRTQCFHLTDHVWDPDLCRALEVPVEVWPEVRPSVGSFTSTFSVPGLPDGIPIAGVLGDQQAALLGQACIEEGAAKCTYGTGAFLLMNTGKKAVRSKHRLLSTIAWALDEKNYTYALEGSAFIAGAATQWVRDGLGLIKKSSDIEKLAASVESSDGVVFVPSLTGLGAPYWNARATGMLTGITRGTGPGNIARAVLEGVAFQNADILTAMQADLGRPITSLNVDGGAAVNDLLMQFQSDILGARLLRPVFTETTSLGAVFAAGLGVGIWKDLSEIRKTWKQEREFSPSFSETDRREALKRWSDAVARVNLQP